MYYKFINELIKMESDKPEKKEITLSVPKSTDGYSLNKLIESCPPLDTNSIYCNILQCYHFAETSVSATMDNELVGFISGYIIPEKPDTLFIWQVAVSNAARGKGLAISMLEEILNRDACKGVSYLETTITQANDASWALFRKLARNLSADITDQTVFYEKQHFNGQHESEQLVRIGPFTI